MYHECDKKKKKNFLQKLPLNVKARFFVNDTPYIWLQTKYNIPRKVEDAWDCELFDWHLYSVVSLTWIPSTRNFTVSFL